uniref:Uncharacterized protein n=1 Tax=Anguilla anguilla TaxID=7936 RepID=A0A0E9RFQ3_ANGAN
MTAKSLLRHGLRQWRPPAGPCTPPSQ